MCISALYRSMKAKTIIWINPAVNRNKVQQHFTKKLDPSFIEAFNTFRKKGFVHVIIITWQKTSRQKINRKNKCSEVLVDSCNKICKQYDSKLAEYFLDKNFCYLYKILDKCIVHWPENSYYLYEKSNDKSSLWWTFIIKYISNKH